MSYEVKLVSSNSNDLLSKYVEDEEEMFVIQDTGEGINWWCARDFFYVKGEMNFEEVE